MTTAEPGLVAPEVAPPAPSLSTYRVLYADTDPMGIVYHANYLKLAELGRNDFCRGFGLSYRDIEASGFFLPVVETAMKFVRPARFDDVVSIHSWVARKTRIRLEFQFEILRDGELLVCGNTVLACLSKEGRPTRLPAPLDARVPVLGPKAGVPFSG